MKLSSQPVVTATIQATFLSSISNVLGQVIYAHRHSLPFEFDPLAFLRFIIVTVLTAPPNFFWQAWLERTFPGRRGHSRSARGASTSNILSLSPRTSQEELDLAERGAKETAGDAEERRLREKTSGLNWANTAKKWFIDCITLGALFNTVAFLLLMGILKGKAGGQIAQTIKHDTLPIIVAGYKVWPLASVVSFSLIPVEKRIVFLSAVGLCWGIYMSLIAADV